MIQAGDIIEIIKYDAALIVDDTKWSAIDQELKVHQILFNAEKEVLLKCYPITAVYPVFLRALSIHRFNLKYRNYIDKVTIC